MEIEQFLDKLGLGQYEKKAYNALLHLKNAKSKEISKESNVSYGRIYEILDKLEKRGLISSLPTQPRTFELIEPKVAFKLILKQQENEITNLMKDVEKIKVPQIKKSSKIKEQTLILHGKQRQLAMITEMKNRAEKEIMSIPGVFEPKKFGSNFAAQQAMRRGVKSRRLLRQVSRKNKKIIKENLKLGEKMKHCTLMGLRLGVVDRKEAIITIVDPDTKDRISIYTSNKDFANSLAIFFDSLWDKSKTIKL